MPQANSVVQVRRESVTLPTYLPEAPDRNPMFLEKRVYQGSSGRVYPLPYYDRIAEKPVPHTWDAIHLENEFIYAMILPEIGGRIHILRDKTNGYDAIYNQPVIKPALVGLAGPWLSGGIEFNWPQHHRPATFMPVEVAIENAPDGSVTVWLGDHDPMARMKGLHGVCLRPGRAVLEVKVRAYNRTTDTQTFLWWANVATQVHERYESFFPTDVTYVADHAKRAMSTFPFCSGHYYGVDYAGRGKRGVPPSEAPRQYPPTGDYAANNLAWYANIPVPTSYMCMGSADDFFGGYDHRQQAGIVHVANHHISPGKKQWTWGNHDFGYAWDRNLTDARPDGEYPPYIELMAGVYTDNQPDFSFLQPGETKTWSQYWYPIQRIGSAHQANIDAAAHLHLARGQLRLGVAVTSTQPAARLSLLHSGQPLERWTRDLAPDRPFVEEIAARKGIRLTDLTLVVESADGTELLRYTPRPPAGKTDVPPAATEPAAPAAIAGNDELYLTGLHLEQYRHATRSPELYWREALRRDPGDARCHLALGRWHLRRGEFAAAETHLRASVARLTLRNPNPSDGEPLYQLGLCLRHLGRDDEAYTAFYKATWNQAWAAASYHALAEIDTTQGRWSTALDHLDRALRFNTDNLRARALRVIVLRRLDRSAEANDTLAHSRALDPLDAWTRHLQGEPFPRDNHLRLDVAHDYARAGLFAEAIALLTDAPTDLLSGTAPLIGYTLGWLHARQGDLTAAKKARAHAAAAPTDYCFPARLEDIAVLTSAIAANKRDPRAPYYLGNLLYDRRRHAEAIALWQRSARLDATFPTVWRNLGIGLYNLHHDATRALQAYEKAVKAAPGDARLVYERDQLWKRTGESPERRLAALQSRRPLVERRDDLSIEFCTLLNDLGRAADALAILSSRAFQPWEGGEGRVLGQFVRAHLALGRAALDRNDPATARQHFAAALQPPDNLGEARHLLANQSDVHLALGDAYSALGDKQAARATWTLAADFRGDFQDMSVRLFSEMTYFSAVALARLGRRQRSRKLLTELRTYARQLKRETAKIDYFATSLPTMLLFDDDLTVRQQIAATVMEAQAELGLGQTARARQLLRNVLARDPNHSLARDLLPA